MTSLRASLGSLLTGLARVGADPSDDKETRLQKALLVLIAASVLPISLLWGCLYLAVGAPSGTVAFLYFAISLTSIAVFARTRDFAGLLRVQLLAILLAPTTSMVPTGGFLASGGVGFWGILAPLGALVFGSVRTATRWWIAFVTVFLASGVAGELSGGMSRLPPWFSSTMLALNVVVGGTIVFILLALFAQQRQDALTALRSAQDRAETLLLNILPRAIAEQLQAEPHTIAEQFPAASILFADVADFTRMSEHLPPAEVVGVLDRLFSHFDTLAEQYGVEKIKTIGDSYMAAAGVPSPRSDHAQALAGIALDMLDAMRSREVVGDLGMELRIGINSGPVVAGVIGHKRFLYDLWGDAVNTASRMESHGTAGRIQITRATYELIKDEFVCERRGTVAVKGKGELETWYLLGRREDLLARPRATAVSEVASGRP